VPFEAHQEVIELLLSLYDYETRIAELGTQPGEP
jgi:hypothetical protein